MTQLAAFDFPVLGAYLFRLGAAALAGGIIGLDREAGGHWAGLRTHMIVAVGAALFVLLGANIADDDPNAQARIVQGVAAGIGFLGAGTILKLSSEKSIRGLTTAATIWLSAGLGAVAGLARYELMAASLIVALGVLILLRPLTKRIGGKRPDEAHEESS